MFIYLNIIDILFETIILQNIKLINSFFQKYKVAQSKNRSNNLSKYFFKKLTLTNLNEFHTYKYFKITPLK